VLGHGHAPGADVAADIDPALGHGVGGTVAGVAVHDDLGPGIEPAHVVGHRSVDLDHRVGETHGAHALPGVAGDADGHNVPPGPPEAAADAVLAEGVDLQPAMAVGNRLLDLLFEDARPHALAVPLARNKVDGCCPALLGFAHMFAPDAFVKRQGSNVVRAGRPVPFGYFSHAPSALSLELDQTTYLMLNRSAVR
jgi:hypothetical protein